MKKGYLWILTSLVVVLIVSNVQAQSSRIVFSSDQGTTSLLDLWTMPGDGDPETQLHERAA